MHASPPTSRPEAKDAESQGEPEPGKPWRIADLEMQFMPVGGGSFLMGSNDGEANERPVLRVSIVYDFWLGRTQVTQAQHEVVMGMNPSHFKGPSLPVEMVSWDDAVKYCEVLTQRESAAGRLPVGWEYRLPSEAEWEYAARGGAKSREYTYAGSNNVGDVAWYGENSGSRTHPVGGKAANELGLHDISGNVWEWCEDAYHDSYAGAPTDGSAWLGSGPNRVNRGGSWGYSAGYVRVALRRWLGPSCTFDNLGFRVCLARSR